MIEPGTELGGRYQVVRLLGEGGMGAVYEAVHVAIARRVAVKVLHGRFSRNAEAVGRFTREARAAAAIGHPNIVDVLDLGTHGRQPFIAMELLRGETVAERLARVGVLAPDEACRLAGHVLSALAAAHAAGIVHRDLKPENVFLHAVGGGREVIKLLDFGVSKFQRHDAVALATTAEGALMGTPAYMAPEQWLGQRDVDHRADLFAVGVMLYEMLTGALPYEGDGREDLCNEVTLGTATPAPPSEIAPDVPAALDPVVLRAVSRDRDARFATALELLDALRPFGAADVPVGSAPAALDADLLARVSPPAPEPTLAEAPAARAAPRRAGSVAGSVAAAAVAALALVGGGWGLARMRDAPTSPPITPVLTATLAAPIAPPSPPSPWVRVELRGLPPGATVALDGARAEAPVLRLARGSGRHAVRIEAGARRHDLEVGADEDQVIVLDLAPPTSPAPPAAAVAARHRPAARTAPRAAPRPRPEGSTGRAGVGLLQVSREF